MSRSRAGACASGPGAAARRRPGKTASAWTARMVTSRCWIGPPGARALSRPASQSRRKEGAPPLPVERPCPVIDRGPIGSDEPRPAEPASQSPPNPSLARSDHRPGPARRRNTPWLRRSSRPVRCPICGDIEVRELRATTAFAAGEGRDTLWTKPGGEGRHLCDATPSCGGLVRPRSSLDLALMYL
jgi:hypothetical protein